MFEDTHFFLSPCILGGDFHAIWSQIQKSNSALFQEKNSFRVIPLGLLQVGFSSLFPTCYRIPLFRGNTINKRAHTIKKETRDIDFVGECCDGQGFLEQRTRSVSGGHAVPEVRCSKQVNPRQALDIYQDVYRIGLIQLFFPDFSQDLPNGTRLATSRSASEPASPAQPPAPDQPRRPRALQFTVPFLYAATSNS